MEEKVRTIVNYEGNFRWPNERLLKQKVNLTLGLDSDG